MSVVGAGQLGVDVADLSADVVQGIEDASGNAVQGWISSGYLQRSAAPVLKYRKTGTSARLGRRTSVACSLSSSTSR